MTKNKPLLVHHLSIVRHSPLATGVGGLSFCRANPADQLVALKSLNCPRCVAALLALLAETRPA